MIVHSSTKLNSRRKKVRSFDDGAEEVCIYLLELIARTAVDEGSQRIGQFKRHQNDGAAGCTLPAPRRTGACESRATESESRPARYTRSATKENCSPASHHWCESAGPDPANYGCRD